MKHMVLYVPGIGDDKRGLQAKLVKLWYLYGVEGRVYEMPWMDQQPFEPKLQKLLAHIDELHAAGHTISLVGASAGAGAVINAFAARKDKINGVVVLCAKVNNPDSIGENYRRRSPSFLESALQVQFSLDKLDDNRQRIMSRYAIIDEVILRRDSVVLGGINKTVCSFGHAITITQQLIFGAPYFISWLKSLHSHKKML